MNTDEKILKALGDLQAEVTGIKDVQQKQGKRFESLEAGQKTLEAGQQALQSDVKGLHAKVDTVELKVEAINAYQKQAQTEIMEHLIESNEVNGQAQQQLEKEIEHIKKHVGLPPVK